jgi:hypothetical protein
MYLSDCGSHLNRKPREYIDQRATQALPSALVTTHISNCLVSKHLISTPTHVRQPKPTPSEPLSTQLFIGIQS